ncbi:MAG: CRISPR-associated protein Cas5 [Egibacteraceae bacterium]
MQVKIGAPVGGRNNPLYTRESCAFPARGEGGPARAERAPMKALRVSVDAPVASFRYPHFLVGRQVSYPAPPPTTVRGLLASALGLHSCPAERTVAYRFTCLARVDDLEHQHLLAPSGGTLPGTRLPKVVEGAVNPVRREMLFGCRLELLVAGGDLDHLAQALHAPAFAMSLGRSQDLAAVTAQGTVDLVEAAGGYYEDALLPGALRVAVRHGLGLVMPVALGPPPERAVEFGGVVWVEGHTTHDGPGPVLVDPDSPLRNGQARAVAFFAAL